MIIISPSCVNEGEITLRLRYPGLQYQLRTLRVLQGNWTAVPYSTELDPALLGSGSNDPDLFQDVYNIPSNVYTLNGSVVPGTCMMRSANGLGTVTICSGVLNAATPLTFGLLNNFVAGTFDELWGDPYISVWQGYDSVYQLIAPAFNPTGLSALFSAAAAGAPVPLYAGPDGRLAGNDGGGVNFPAGVTSRQVVAYLLDYPTNGYCTIQLKV